MTGCDWTKMQERLFVIPSFAFLRAEVERLVRRIHIDLGEGRD